MPRKEPGKRSVGERLLEELRKIFAIALFFSVAFCIIIFADNLTVPASGVGISYAKALIGGLIVAKVLLIVDLLPIVDRFYGKPLVNNIVWKSTLYVAASLVFRYIDPVVTSLFKGLGLAAGHHEAVHRFAQPRFWAVEIWVAVILVIYVTARELVRAVGRDQLKAMFLGR